MNINRNNYEAYFLDYRENNLSPGQVAELLIFLEQNPDLKNEFESFKYFQLVPDKNTRFEHKENLKKNDLIPTDNIDSSNYDNYIVADLEGDLSEDDDIELKAFISLNPKTRLEYNFYRSTFLKPDKSIQFTGKDKLKKTGLLAIYRTQMVYALAVAASIIILLGVYFGFLKQPDEQKIITSVETQEVTPVKKDAKTLPESPLNIPRQKEEDLLAQNPEQIKVMNSEIEQITRLSANFRMSVLPGKNVKTIDGNSIAFAEYRKDEPLFSGEAVGTPTSNTEKQQSFVSRFIAGLAGKVIKTDNLKGKSFLDYTIDGYNLMADKQVSIEREVDENGKVIAYLLNGENVSFSRNKNQVKQ